MDKRLFILVLIICVLFAGCNKSYSFDISENTKFGHVTLNISAEEFQDKGFSLGDSLNVKFSNGYKLKDIPFYNGYYVKNGEPLVVAYPGYGTVEICLNNLSLWETAKLTSNDTVKISLNEKGKYIALYESLGQQYSYDRNDYLSDIQYCNFRALSGGNLKSDFLYRGASPVDNLTNRASYTDDILEQYYIGYILNLADSAEELKGYTDDIGFDSPYALGLIESGNAILLDMSSSFQSDLYKEKLVSGLKDMINHNGPVYIHCLEGKDRTGFVCFIIEALAGATYDEMKSDYMTTYDNYYSVNEKETKEKYDGISSLYFDGFIEYLHGEVDVNADFTDDAKAYLKFGGMTDIEIENLIDYISK